MIGTFDHQVLCFAPTELLKPSKERASRPFFGRGFRVRIQNSESPPFRGFLCARERRYEGSAYGDEELPTTQEVQGAVLSVCHRTFRFCRAVRAA